MVVRFEQHDGTQLGPLQASRDHFLCAELLLQIWESGSDHGRWNSTSVGGRWWGYVHLNQRWMHRLLQDPVCKSTSVGHDA